MVPSGKNKKKLFASESGTEEAQMELDQLLLQFEDWRKDHEGSFKDFLKSNKDLKVKKLKDGGTVNDNSYAQLIDDYLDNIEVIEIDGVKESLTTTSNEWAALSMIEDKGIRSFFPGVRTPDEVKEQQKQKILSIILILNVFNAI